jgi:hypothetical protein
MKYFKYMEPENNTWFALVELNAMSLKVNRWIAFSLVYTYSSDVRDSYFEQRHHNLVPFEITEDKFECLFNLYKDKRHEVLR